MDCIFCKIANHEAPASIVYENEHVIVFKDHRPKASIHLLITPKKHTATFLDTPDDEIAYLIKVCRALADNLKVANGFRLQINNGPEGGQIIFHLHVHFMSWIKELPAERLELDIARDEFN